MIKLPTIGTPTYETDLISVEGSVKYRPFLVGEQKDLLMAASSEDSDEILRSLKTCISNCTFGVIDVDTLPIFDLITLFIRIRSKAVGEILEKVYICQGEDGKEGERCGQEIGFSINLDDIKPEISDGHSQVVSLTDTVGVKMKYPTLSQLAEINNIEDLITQIDIIIDCIDSIYSDEDIVSTEDVPRVQLVEWVDALDTTSLTKLVEFFLTQPKVTKSMDITCPKCKTKATLVLEDIDDFF